MEAPGERLDTEAVIAWSVVVHVSCMRQTGEREHKDAPEVNLRGIFTGDLGDHRAYFDELGYLSSWAVWDPAPTTSRAWSSW